MSRMTWSPRWQRRPAVLVEARAPSAPCVFHLVPQPLQSCEGAPMKELDPASQQHLSTMQMKEDFTSAIWFMASSNHGAGPGTSMTRSTRHFALRRPRDAEDSRAPTPKGLEAMQGVEGRHLWQPLTLLFCSCVGSLLNRHAAACHSPNTHETCYCSVEHFPEGLLEGREAGPRMHGNGPRV